jgi:hypothetical protein
MRITFMQLDDFLVELDREAAAGHVRNRELFVRIDRAPEQELEISFLVVIWATACTEGSDGELRVLEYGAECGSDERSDTAGTAEAVRRTEAIAGVATKHNLTVRRGKLEMF